MNPTQLAVRQSIIGARFPRIEQDYMNEAASATVTVTIPRGAGKLCIVWVNTLGATVLPTVLTGFTSIATAGTVARVMYRFLNGSEAATLTSTATTSSNTIARVILVSGCILTSPPVAAILAQTASTPTPTAPALTNGSPTRKTLWLVDYVAGAAQTIFHPPAGFSSNYRRSSLSDAGGTFWRFNSFAEYITTSSLTPGIATGNTSTGWWVATIAIRAP